MELNRLLAEEEVDTKAADEVCLVILFCFVCIVSLKINRLVCFLPTTVPPSEAVVYLERFPCECERLRLVLGSKRNYCHTHSVCRAKTMLALHTATWQLLIQPARDYYYLIYNGWPCEASGL